MTASQYARNSSRFSFIERMGARSSTRLSWRSSLGADAGGLSGSGASSARAAAGKSVSRSSGQVAAAFRPGCRDRDMRMPVQRRNVGWQTAAPERLILPPRWWIALGLGLGIAQLERHALEAPLARIDADVCHLENE